jgi:hypothetical protein
MMHMATESRLDDLHRKSRQNRAPLKKARVCGCFNCFNEYLFEQIADWIDDGQTAICPRCGADAVLGFASQGADQDVLHKLHDRWLKQPVRLTSGEWERALKNDHWQKTK